jgi:hypothetical protein
MTRAGMNPTYLRTASAVSTRTKDDHPPLTRLFDYVRRCYRVSLSPFVITGDKSIEPLNGANAGDCSARLKYSPVGRGINTEKRKIVAVSAI